MNAEVIDLDFETRSAIDIRAAGAYRYADDESTDVLCCCYSFDDGPVHVWQKGDPVPHDLVQHKGLFRAHNFQFEKSIWHYIMVPRYGWPEPKLLAWDCTAARAAAMALPRGLDNLARILGVKERKDEEGYRLMLTMCKPMTIYASRKELSLPRLDKHNFTELSDGRVIRWTFSEDKLRRLITYCKQDVRVEQACSHLLPMLDEDEHHIFLLDAEINDRGLKLDIPLIQHCQGIVKVAQKRLTEEMEALCGHTPTQVARIVDWLGDNGLKVDSLAAEPLEQLLQQELPDDIRRVLEIRDEASRTSTAKFTSMQLRRHRDGRARGNFLYCGAHTTRWSGAGFQPQNLMRPTGDVDIGYAIRLLEQRADAETLELLIGEPAMQVVAECMRGMIVPEDGYEYITADFSNIEGRVNAWINEEEWKVQAFRDYDEILGFDDKGEPIRKGRDLYLVAAEGINGVPANTYTKKSPERQHGKVAELSMGYQGGIRAFKNMAKNYHVHVTDQKADEIKLGWRAAHPRVEQGWKDLDEAAMEAVRHPGRTYGACNGNVEFRVQGPFLFMRVPSGKTLKYCRPEIRIHRKTIEVMENGVLRESKMEKESVSYWGNLGAQWVRKFGYGGFWCENAVQKISRDLLTGAMQRAKKEGYALVLHSHDEAMAEVKIGSRQLKDFEALMAAGEPWSTGCPISAEGWQGMRYRK